MDALMDHNIMRRVGIGVSSVVFAAGLLLAAGGTAFANTGGTDHGSGSNHGGGGGTSGSGGTGSAGVGLNLFTFTVGGHQVNSESTGVDGPGGSD
jgi:hypothetical protein